MQEGDSEATISYRASEGMKGAEIEVDASPIVQEGDSEATVSDRALESGAIDEQIIHNNSSQIQPAKEVVVETFHVIPLNPTPIAVNIHPMISRKKSGNIKPKVYATQYKKVPGDVHESLVDDEWRAATMAEYEALMSNKTW
ncbi:hypothetical protein V6N12_043060 [Hibiscus sabdariffa]|uniref:Uncharacterized protein n=1 Tax=Hibiscus sabdariffa TaxID=183260 RepID=A0ABR2DI48_9ROSI